MRTTASEKQPARSGLFLTEKVVAGPDLIVDLQVYDASGRRQFQQTPEPANARTWGYIKQPPPPRQQSHGHAQAQVTSTTPHPDDPAKDRLRAAT